MFNEGVMFPSTGLQTLSALIHFLGVSVLAHCVSHRLSLEDLRSFAAIRHLTWPRLCIILVFIDSWLFLFSSGVLIFGVGLESNSEVCSSAIFVCIAFYATSKILIYAFLIEKVHVVWSPAAGSKRFRSRIYVACLVTLVLYAVVIGLLMIIGSIHHLRNDGFCVIGLKSYATIPLLAYDFSINVALTMFFLWPLKSSVVNPKVKRVATRTLIAASVALTTSMVNILVLTILNGKQLGWVCLGSCGSDVILNATALFWVTGPGSASSSGSAAAAAIGVPDRARQSNVNKKGGASSIFVNVPPPGLEDSHTVSVCEFAPQEQPTDPKPSVARRGSDMSSNGKSASMFPSLAKLFKREASEPDADGVQVCLRDPVNVFDRDHHLNCLLLPLKVTVITEMEMLSTVDMTIPTQERRAVTSGEDEDSGPRLQ